MAVFNFSAIADGAAISFDPEADVLNFDEAAIAAAEVRAVPSGADVIVTYLPTGKSVTLLEVSVFQLATSNVVFANGSRLLFGDDSTALGDDTGNSLTGTAGDDLIAGFGGSDALAGGGGNDVVDGGAGFDTLHFEGHAVSGVVVDFAGGTASGGGAGGAGSVSFSGIERVVTGELDDHLIGDDAAQNLTARAGNDTLEGRGGNDTLWAGSGANAFVFRESGAAHADLVGDFTSGLDRIVLDGTVMIELGEEGEFAADDPRFWAAAGATSGHDADDRVVYDTSTTNLYYDPDGSGAGAAQLIATLRGAGTIVASDIVVEDDSAPGGATEGDDHLVGTAGDDTIDGLGGNDTIEGLAGDDSLDGNAGDDLLLGGDGNDTLVGGSGWDRLEGGGGDDLLDATAGTAGPRDTELTGGAGNDVLLGSAEDDVLSGGAGNDRLEGGADAGNTVDSLSGGTGQDSFVFRSPPANGSHDIVADFSSMEADKLVFDAEGFTAIGAGGNFAAGDARFFAGAGATGGQDADDRVIYNTTTREVFYDADGSGSGAAQLIATLQSGVTLVASDIVVEGEGTPPAGPTDGDDHLVGTAGDDTIDGLGGDDLIEGLGGNDTLIGGLGEDRLLGGDGDDRLVGEEFRSDESADVLEGGPGNDIYEVDFLDSIAADPGGTDLVLARNTDWTLVAGLENLDLVDSVGSAFNGTGNELDNVIRSASEGGTLSGMGGNDTLILRQVQNTATARGGDGDDILRGNHSSVFFGDAGNDLLDATGVTSMTGGTGADVFLFENAGFDDSILDFASGVDTIRLDATDMAALGASGRIASGDERFVANTSGFAEDASDRVVYNTTTGELWYDADGSGAGAAGLIAILDAAPTLASTDIEIINGTSTEGEHIVGTDAGETLTGTSGDDTILGLGGSDSIDLIPEAGASYGNDVVDGGSGFDTLNYAFRASSGIVADFGAGLATGGGPGGEGSASFSGIERVVTDAFDDLIIGDAAGQNLTARAGNDILEGRGGNDTLWGGSGANAFVFRESGAAHADLVGDFTSGLDRIVLDGAVMTELGEEGRFAADDPRFWAAAGATSGHDADDRVVYDTSTTNLYYDPDGSGAGAAQLIATLRGAGAIVATDIVVEDGSAPGGATEGDDHLVGTAGDDTIDGLGGDDLIEGLGGNDTLLGGDGSDALEGSDGNDTLDGGPGPDTLDGGSGDDSYVVTSGDVIIDSGGIDLVMAAMSWTLQDSLENLVIETSDFFAEGEGNTLDNDLTGIGDDIRLYGRAGNDTLQVESRFSIVEGDDGNDTLIGGSGFDNLDGGAGDDVLDDRLDDDPAAFSEGGANFAGGAGNDIILGGAADDLVQLGGDYGNDRVDGGAGRDSITFESALSAVAVSLVVGTANGGGSGGAGSATLSGVENVYGGSFGDEITGDSGANVLSGRSFFFHAPSDTDGNDVLDGLEGNDTLEGGLGADQFVFSVAPGAANADSIVDFANGSDGIVLDGAAHANSGAEGRFSAGDARFFAGPGANGGQDPTDRVIYNTTTGELWYDADGSGSGAAQLLATLQGAPSLAATDIAVVNGSTAPGPTEGDDHLIGTPGDDTIDGLGGDDVIEGLAGNDSLDGGAGDDLLLGGDGDDTLIGLEGADTLRGGDGNDSLVGDLSRDGVAKVLDGGFGDDLYHVGELDIILDDPGGMDTVIARNTSWTLGPGLEDLTLEDTAGRSDIGTGNELDNEIRSSSEGGTLRGLGGNDLLILRNSFNSSEAHGGEGNDTLVGGLTSNRLFGDDGDDVLIGEYGLDTLTGGTGADTFVFVASPGDEFTHDSIADFASAIDTLELDATVMPALGPSGRFASGDERFFAAAGASSGQDSSDRVVYDTTTGELWYDGDGSGSGAAHLLATLQSAPSLAATDIAVINGGNPGEEIVGTDGSETLTGTSGDDTILGQGGSDSIDLIPAAGASYGDDVVDGGSGFDTLNYAFRASSGIVADFATGLATGGGPGGEGSASFSGIERVVTDAFDDVILGDAAGQNLTARGGNDTLEGRGGNDTLWGGTGEDRFVFREAGASHADLVGDFGSADTVALDGTAMSELGAAGVFAEDDDRFWAASGATSGHDADDRVVYDTSTGDLYYDADGSGSGAAELVATLRGTPGLTADDMTVI